MKFYFILPNEPSEYTKEKAKNLEQYGEVEFIKHIGKVSEIAKLKEDNDEKVIGLDPDVVEWDTDSEAFDNIKNVRAVCVNATSFSWVKPTELREKGIAVYNCPHFSADSVAEYIICLAIEGARRVAVHKKNNNKIDWSGSSMLLKRKKMGILGLGTIGKKVAENAKGMGMDVIYWSKNTRDDRFTYVELDELFRSADVFVPAMAENEETKILVTHSRMDSMKKSVIIVGLNKVSKMMDVEYIIKKVAENKLGGYAFEDDEVKDLSEYEGNVWGVPPVAWYSEESLTNLIDMWFDDMVMIAKGTPINLVN